MSLIIHDAAIITNAQSHFGLWSIEAVASSVQKLIAVQKPNSQGHGDHLRWFPNVEVVEFDISDETAWEKFVADCRARDLNPSLIIHAAPDLDPESDIKTRTTDYIRSPWLTQKYALELITKDKPASILFQIAREIDNEGSLGLWQDGEIEALRISNAAVLQDGIKREIRPRLNRLVFDRDCDQGSFKAAVRALQDDRSSFMTGAEVTLKGKGDSNAIPDPSLSGKTILVTGATSGIGRALAIEAGRLGAWVAVGGRKLDAANETLNQIRAAGGDGMVVKLDVNLDENWIAARDAIIAARGQLNGLVNNAGEGRNKSIEQLNSDDIEFLFDVNYRAPLKGMAHLASTLEEGAGAILNISSVAGLRGGPGGSGYGASKAGLIGLSQAFARQHPRLRVNALEPGFIWSDSVVEALGAEGAQAFRDYIEPKTPLGRVGLPDEVARMGCFLLSDAAHLITGQSIAVSGGLELSFP